MIPQALIDELNTADAALQGAIVLDATVATATAAASAAQTQQATATSNALAAHQAANAQAAKCIADVQAYFATEQTAPAVKS
jgi:hypothetical protein